MREGWAPGLAAGFADALLAVAARDVIRLRELGLVGTEAGAVLKGRGGEGITDSEWVRH